MVEDDEEISIGEVWARAKWTCAGRFLEKKMEEEVMDKYKVEDGKREAFRGEGAPSEWRRVRKNRKYRIRKWGGDCWARIFCRQIHLTRHFFMRIYKQSDVHTHCMAQSV